MKLFTLNLEQPGLSLNTRPYISFPNIEWWRFQTYLSTPSWRRIQVWRLYQNIQIVFSFDIIRTLSPISVLTKSRDNISAIFFKIPKVTIWRKQQKHWRARKDCWRMSGIVWTATPWFVILLRTYFYFILYPYLLVNILLFCW